MSDLVTTKAKDLRTGDRVKLDGEIRRVTVCRVLSSPDRIPAVELRLFDGTTFLLDRFETVFRAPRRRSSRKSETSN